MYLFDKWKIADYVVDKTKIKQINSNLSKIESLNFKNLNKKTKIELINLYFFIKQRYNFSNLSDNELESILNKTNYIILQKRQTKFVKKSPFITFFRYKRATRHIKYKKSLKS